MPFPCKHFMKQIQMKFDKKYYIKQDKTKQNKKSKQKQKQKQTKKKKKNEHNSCIVSLNTS